MGNRVVGDIAGFGLPGGIIDCQIRYVPEVPGRIQIVNIFACKFITSVFFPFLFMARRMKWRSNLTLPSSFRNSDNFASPLSRPSSDSLEIRNVVADCSPFNSVSKALLNFNPSFVIPKRSACSQSISHSLNRWSFVNPVLTEIFANCFVL